MVNLILNSLAVSPKAESSGLLSLTEYKDLRMEFDFRDKGIKIDNNFNAWRENKLISASDINFEYFKQYYERKNTLDEKRNRIFFIDYIILNMVFDKINMDQKFIVENVFTKNSRVIGRLEVLSSIYNQRKPNEFPNISEIKHMKNKWFAISLVVFHPSIDKLSEKNITDELFYCYRLHSIRGRDLTGRFREFAMLFHPYLVKMKIMDKKENVIKFLYDLWSGKPLTDIDDMWRHFNSKFNSYKNTEFYSVLYEFLNECIQKRLMSLDKLKVIISDWERLANLCFRHNVKFIKDIKIFHRDEFIQEYIDKIKMKATFNSIRKVLEFYNDILMRDELDAQHIISNFSSKHLPKRPEDINHVGLMETGLKALISSVGSEIIQSRTKPIEEMNFNELINYFLVRLIWIIMITGSRVNEVAKLLLNDVKNALDYNEPYIKLQTLKNNNDREVVLSRGEKLDGTFYELDVIHIDILKETIAASEMIHSGFDLDKKYLFSNLRLSKYDSGTVSQKLKKIQRENGIVCGSHYDILSREIYESFPVLNKKLVNKNELFTTHDLRHANINWMLLHGGLSRYEIQKYIGHTNISSQEDYVRTSATLLEVAEIMQANDHYGAKNELISPNYIKIDDKIDRAKLVLNKDIDDYLMHFESQSLHQERIEAEQYIDQNTDCNVIVSCSASGISCLACKDFEAGSYSQEKMDNISIIFMAHIQTIDTQIDKINKNKRSLLTKKSEPLFINAIYSLIDRFIILDDAMKVTLISQKQGFNLEEKNAKKIIYHLLRKNRKLDLDPTLIKQLKKLKSEGKLSIDLTLYKSVNNRRIFV